jgi:methylmalonyl-CoA mutase N-terminal domain/subunit
MKLDPEDVSVRLSRTLTWGGLETNSVYGPDDLVGFDPERDLGRPGQYPFTRGSYPDMYRARMWTLRNIVGYGAPEDTRDGIRRALEAGSAGINIVVDAISQEAVDPDHPLVETQVGQEGCSVPSLRDLERLLEGIDVTATDVAWHSTMMIYPLVAALVRKQGRSLSKLQGSHMPDHLGLTLAGWGETIMPPELGHRTAVDCLEFSARHSPRWALGMPQGYDLRERGCTPAAEIAIGMAIVNQTLSDLAARGVGVDEVAPSMAWVSTADIDLFEEVAKFRALRRIWARTMRHRFNAESPRSLQLRIACHTSGRSLTYQQPLNNLTRAAIETLAALLGGVQAVETCTYDEPISIPTHEARELATRTQQILAHEVGAARTSDPLGGSWYVESLTNRVEHDALGLLDMIEQIGVVKAVQDGTIEQLMDDYNVQLRRELDTGERIVVGVNRFAPAEDPAPRRFTFDRGRVESHVRRFVEMKQARDQQRLEERLRDLYRVARQRENSHPAMIDALLADGTIGEVWGTVRAAHGYSYDPFRAVAPPCDYEP